MRNLPGLLFYSDKIIYRLARHLFLFVSMNMLFCWVLIMRDTPNAQPGKVVGGVFVNSLFFFGYAYLTAYIFVPRMLSMRRYLLFFLSFLLSGMFLSFLKFYFSDLLFYDAIAGGVADSPERYTLSQILMNTKDMTFIVAIFLIAKYAKDNYHSRLRIMELQDHQIKSEIKLLKKQLDPHVVFNNLNNIYCLALNNSEAVADPVSRLRSLLSYYFVEAKEQLVGLKQELNTISDFISLEKLRYGDRLAVDFTVEGDTENKRIAPFVLFSFIENCFEHGCSIDSGSAWVKIKVMIGDDSLDFHASNSKPENLLQVKEDHGKHAFYSIKTRLQLLYPGKHLLRTEERKESYSIDLKIRF